MRDMAGALYFLEELADLQVDLLYILWGARVLLSTGGVSDLLQDTYIGIAAVGDGKNFDAFARVGTGDRNVFRDKSYLLGPWLRITCR